MLSNNGTGVTVYVLLKYRCNVAFLSKNELVRYLKYIFPYSYLTFMETNVLLDVSYKPIEYVNIPILFLLPLQMPHTAKSIISQSV